MIWALRAQIIAVGWSLFRLSIPYKNPSRHGVQPCRQ